MALTSKSKPAAQVAKELKAKNEVKKVKLTDTSFNVLSQAIAKSNHFQAEAQKAGKEVSDLLAVAIEGAGMSAGDFRGANLNAETKELELTK